jgi:prepilin-type N-terminal cleavage/methylation domain-containing protein
MTDRQKGEGKEKMKRLQALKQRNQLGFTLNELMIVVAIIAILGTISVPTFLNTMPRYRLRKTARDLCSEMRKARMTAVKQNRNVSIAFDLVKNQYVVDSTLATPPRPTQLESTIVFGFGSATESATTTPGPLPEDPVTFGGETVTFNPRGISNAGFIYLQNGRGEAFAAGARTSGSIILRRWRESDWE